MTQDAQTLELLRDPETGGALELSGDTLLNPATGRRYPLREGVPVFIDQVSGANKKYQEMYDRLAPGYDFAERVFYWFTRKPNYRLEFAQDLEVQSGARVLEVSVGTGANLRLFPATIDFYGLDLSAGMLRKCQRNLQKSGRTARLFQGEAEKLPFRDEVFDCVYHVGGINFFNDTEGAIHEMIRVAKPGTKILISDETQRVVEGQYRKTPIAREYYKTEERKAACPIDMIPKEMEELQTREIAQGRMYCLTFRKPR
jgi:ubiquinone/menaquinone biosynthesis C-methylase UbiE